MTMKFEGEHWSNNKVVVIYFRGYVFESWKHFLQKNTKKNYPQ